MQNNDFNSNSPSTNQADMPTFAAEEKEDLQFYKQMIERRLE